MASSPALIDARAPELVRDGYPQRKAQQLQNLLSYENQNVLVTGAASGMGRATAELLVNLGANVYAVDYAPCDVPGITLGIQANLGERAEIDKAFEQLPETIHKFFGVAGVSGHRNNFTETMVINFLANKYMQETYLDQRIANEGAIVMVSSMGALHWENHLGELDAFIEAGGWDETYRVIEEANSDGRLTGHNAYKLSKRLVNYYSLLRAADLSEKSVRINVIMPGGTQTGLTKDFAELVGGEENLLKGLANRLSSPEEMANAMIFLNSELASYITGVTLPVDAGHSIPETIGQKEKQFDFSILN